MTLLSWLISSSMSLLPQLCVVGLVAAGVWLTRRDLPLGPLVAAGSVALLAGAWLGADQWSWSLWFLEAGLVGAALTGLVVTGAAVGTWLRPGEAFERTPQDAVVLLLAAAVLHLPVAAAFGAQSGWGVAPALGLSVLALRDSPRLRRVRADAGLVCLWAAGTAVAYVVSRGIPLAIALEPEVLGWLMAPVPLAVVAGLSLRSTGARRPTLFWLAAPVGLLLVAAVLATERTTRTLRHAALLASDNLPASEERGSLGLDACPVTPDDAGTCVGPPLYLWPADQAIGARLGVGRRPAYVAYRHGLGLDAVEVHDPWPEAVPPVPLTRGLDGLRVAGRPVASREELAELVRHAQAHCGGFGLGLDPAVDWTAGEVVAACVGESCTWGGGLAACSWEEGTGFVIGCAAGGPCTAQSGTTVRCPGGGCSVQANHGYGCHGPDAESCEPPDEPIHVVCDAGGCTVDPARFRTTVDCAAGGCTIFDGTPTLRPCTGRCVAPGP